jgi:hypothetical protein
LKAVVFVSGASWCLLQGSFWFVIGEACQSHSEPSPQLIVATLQLILGILLWVTALRKWRKLEDLDPPPPQWMSAIGRLSVHQSAGAGALFPLIAVKQWVFTLSAIGVIGEFGSGGWTGAGAYFLFVLATQIFVLVPIVAYAVAPHRANRPLQETQAWLERNNTTIVIAMSLSFGAWFLFKGVTELIG